MDTFRALVKAGEKSARALEVTEDLIWWNPGHYSIWCVSPFFSALVEDTDSESQGIPRRVPLRDEGG